MEGVDEWRDQVWALLDSFAEPFAVLLVLLAFTLGMLSIRALG
ncbi:hypothetical protein [Microbacterium sediminicola]